MRLSLKSINPTQFSLPVLILVTRITSYHRISQEKLSSTVMVVAGFSSIGAIRAPCDVTVDDVP